MSHLRRVLTYAVLFLCAPSLLADEASQIFDSLYGARLKAVESTPASKDDVEFAATLLASAKQARDTPALLKLICEAVDKLGSRDRTGYGFVVEARRLQSDAIPADRGTCLDRIIEVQQLTWNASRGQERNGAAKFHAASGEYTNALEYYQRGISMARSVRSHSVSDILAEREATANKLRASKRVDDLNHKLEVNPADTESAEELVTIMIVELDDPARAAQFKFLSLNEALKTHITLAAQPIDKLESSQCLSLGDWYNGLALQTRGPMRANMWLHAHRYYERYLKISKSGGLEQKKVELTLLQITASLEKLGFRAPREVTVPATCNRAKAFPTGVTLKKGERFQLFPNPDDKWTGGGSRARVFCDWQGYSGGNWMKMFLKIGDHVEPVASGQTVTSPNDGALELYAEDGKVAQNKGQIRVVIKFPQ
jgi:hypothetical protein